MIRPEISIIIPLYNKKDFIGRAIDSVLRQTFKNYEILIINDGSTDRSPEIVQTYTDPRIRLINQENKGPGAARNRGIQEAHSPYIAFLDADDEWMEDFLDISYNSLTSHCNAALTTTLFCVNKPGTPWKGYSLINFQDGYFELNSCFPPEKLQYIIGAMHAGGSVLCKKEILKKHGGFYENGCKFAEDQFLWLQIILNYKIFLIRKELMIYHLENSELAISGFRSRNREVKPVIGHPEKLRNSCPVDKKPLLENFLGYTALEEAHNLLNFSNQTKIHNFINTFPTMKKWKVSYSKLLFKMMIIRLKNILYK